MADSKPVETETVKPSSALEQQLKRHPCNEKLKIVTPDLAVMIGHRSEYGGSGGCGYFSQVFVFYGNQNDMREWQWRDRYSASRDRRDLRVHDIGEVKVSKKDNGVVIEVELTNLGYGSRTTTFAFKPLTEVCPRPELSAKDQEKFRVLAETEINRIMADLMELWKLKSKMVGPHGDYVPYQEPRVKQAVCHPEIGLAALVTEEQIDHRVSDPQVRYELYLVKFGQEKAQLLSEDHSYEKSQCGAVIAIVNLTADKIIINTRGGKKEIEIK